MYDVSGQQFSRLAMMWPALAAAVASEMAESFAKEYVDLAAQADTDKVVPEPQWATPHTIKLDLKTVRLRDFSTAPYGTPVLLCAPLALHSATVADFAPGHSLVAALRSAGLQRIFVSDWRSASTDMRFIGIDDYLATLNVLVDQLGGQVNLVGLCQGGWMAMLYAARFPTKIHKLAVAGAPIDIAAAPSGLSTLVTSTPPDLFQEIIKLGNGRVLGRIVKKFWGPEVVESEYIREILRPPEPIESPEFARVAALFRAWYSWTMDLPGTYYLEVVDKLYRQNELATGAFVSLGQKVHLASVKVPIFLLAAENDELVAPAQLFATERLVRTPAENLHKALAPGRHLGLFMGRTILTEFWSQIACWLIEPLPTV